jgi:hypothetical protein
VTERLGRFMPCPTCGYQMTEHSAVGGDGPRIPKAGDASACIRCGQVLLYVLDMVGLRFRLPTQPELEQLLEEQRIAQVLSAWVEAFHRTPEMRHS